MDGEEYYDREMNDERLNRLILSDGQYIAAEAVGRARERFNNGVTGGSTAETALISTTEQLIVVVPITHRGLGDPTYKVEPRAKNRS